MSQTIFLWDHHKDDEPFCMCRICYWGRQSDSMENADNVLDWLMGGSIRGTSPLSPLPPLTKPLEVRVKEDLESILAQNEYIGTEEIHKDGIELPEPKYDLTKYEDALAYAKTQCMHDNVQADDPFDPKNVHCNQCDKDMSYNQFMNDRYVRSGSNKQMRRRH